VSLNEEEEGRAWMALAVHCLESHRTFHGWWRSDGGFVLTIVGDPGVGAPLDLRRPPILPHEGLRA
jgi:hypothetical protein